MLKRLFDIFFSLIGLIILSPLFLLIALLIKIDSSGKVFFFQTRVGKGNKDFRLVKFRTMHGNAEKEGLLTIGQSDKRITTAGRILRKYKLDELPQLFNILYGNMSFVGPRPEVRKYVNLYDDEQIGVLEVKPGLTDYASIVYINESDILARSDNPEETYINEIMPKKLVLNLKYIKDMSILKDIKIILNTLSRIF